MYIKEVLMKNIEILRDRLYEAMEKGNKSEILSVSERLDKEIVKMMKRTKESRLLFKQEIKNVKYVF